MNRPNDQAKPEDVGIEDTESNPFLDRINADATAICITAVGLEEVDPRGELALHRIVTTEFRIGRHPECNLVLSDDGRVSRRHARIYRDGEDFVVEDNGSCNGTFVNGQRIELPRVLNPGDKLGIGNHAYTFIKCKDASLPHGV